MLVAPALSLVDLSSVAILDYSCADEVVAKLLLREREPSGSAFFVLTGVKAHHRDPIEAVLERHALAVVAETGPRALRHDGGGPRMGSGPSGREWSGRGVSGQGRWPNSWQRAGDGAIWTRSSPAGSSSDIPLAETSTP